MSFVITPVTELPPPAPATPASPPIPTSSKARVTLDVEIPESAWSFADLVVKANGYRRQARNLVSPPQGSVRDLIVAGASHAGPVAVGIALCFCTGIGEGVATAMALWGGLRCAVPARRASSPLSGQAAEQVRDSAIQAALGLDATGVITMRYAAMNALDEARAACGLSPEAELVAQSLAFQNAEPGGCDATAQLAAATAETLLPRSYVNRSVKNALDEVGAFETLALVDRRAALIQNDYHADHLLNHAQERARQALDAATLETVRRLAAHGPYGE